jgi:hypothetical protein
MDGLEAFANATLGLVVSVLAVKLLWPLFGWQASATQSIAVTGIFWGLSFARSYIIRRVFRWLS